MHPVARQPSGGSLPPAAGRLSEPARRHPSPVPELGEQLLKEIDYKLEYLRLRLSKVKQQRGGRLKTEAEKDAFSGAAFSGVGLLLLTVCG